VYQRITIFVIAPAILFFFLKRSKLINWLYASSRARICGLILARAVLAHGSIRAKDPSLPFSRLAAVALSVSVMTYFELLINSDYCLLLSGRIIVGISLPSFVDSLPRTFVETELIRNERQDQMEFHNLIAIIYCCK